MLRDGGDGRAGLLGGSFCAPCPSGAGERSVPQGWWSWGEGGTPWGGSWIVLPSLSAFVPLFSCIAVSQSHSPGTRCWCFVRELGARQPGRGEPWRSPDRPELGPCPVNGLSLSKLACLRVGHEGLRPGRWQPACARPSFEGAKTTTRLPFSRGIWCWRGVAKREGSARGERARRWMCPPMSPCWGGFGASPAVGLVPKTSVFRLCPRLPGLRPLGSAPNPARPPTPAPVGITRGSAPVSARNTPRSSLGAILM